MKFLMFGASLRNDSLNKKLINLAAQSIGELGHQADLADFSEFEAPLYNADTQNVSGIPDTIKLFIERMHSANGLIISSPEYNFSMPGTLKNFIDWVSRVTPMPWQGQRILLLSASPSLVGGNRGLWAVRVPLESCGSFVYPDMFSLATAQDAFAEDGKLKNAQLQRRLNDILNGYCKMVEKMG